MVNFFSAEIRRLFTRVPRIVALLIIFAITVAVTVFAARIGSTGPIDDYAFMRTAYLLTKVTLVLGVGLTELFFVYDDGFKARLYPAMIGSGISRIKALMFQWLEFVIVTAIDIAIGMVLLIISGVMIGATFDGVTLYQMFAIGISAVLMVALFGSFALIGMTATGSVVLGLVIFIASCIVPPIFMTYVAEFPFQDVVFCTALDKVIRQLMNSKVDWMNLCVIAAYMVVSLGVSVALFRKKELL